MTEYVVGTNRANSEENPVAFRKLAGTSRRIRRLIKELRRDHLADLSTETIALQVSVAFMATLNAYARVRDHAQNIGEVITNEK